MIGFGDALGIGKNLLGQALGGGGPGVDIGNTISQLFQNHEDKMKLMDAKKEIADAELVKTTEQEICTENLKAICEGTLSSVKSGNTVVSSMQKNNQTTIEGLVSG